MTDTELNTNRKLRLEVDELRNERDALQDGVISRDILIDTLRQRIKELKGYKEAWAETAKCRDVAERELAALKQQGEPEVWVRDSGDGHWEFSEPGHGTPLYAATPTCFSSADMADAAAKAARVEREECAKVCEATMIEAITGGNKEYNTGREMGATVCANKIRNRTA